MTRTHLPIVLIALVTAACSATGDTGETTTSSGPPTTVASSTTSTNLEPSPTTSVIDRPPVAWVAPSGVHLAVVDPDGEAIEVLTPCGELATLSDGAPLYEVDVVIDPGHGGPIDTGAVAPTGLAEKEVNLRVGLALHEILAERGVASLMTRTGDYPVPIPTRSAYADMTEASALVSIHHNAPAAPASNIPGVEVFVQQAGEESQRLGGLLYDATMAALDDFDIDWHRAPDAGVMTVINSEGEDAYGMVRLPDTPSALIELGYIANRAEAQLYGDPAYVPAVADALADALELFLSTSDVGADLVEGRFFDPRAGVGRDQCIEPDLEQALYPDVVSVDVGRSAEGLSFAVTISSPYDSPERYADAFRVVGDDGVVYGIRELLHDHSAEQPFTRSLGPIDIPEGVGFVVVEGRDRVYGWGGSTMTVRLR